MCDLWHGTMINDWRFLAAREATSCSCSKRKKKREEKSDKIVRRGGQLGAEEGRQGHALG